MTLLFLTFGISIIIILSYSQITHKDIKKQAFSSVQQTIKETASEVDSLVNFATSGIQLTSLMISQTFQNEFYENPNSTLELFLNKTPFDDIVFFPKDAEVNITNKKGFMNLPEFVDSEFYNEALKGKTGVCSVDQKFSEDSVLFFYTPLFEGSEIVGSLNGVMHSKNRLLPLLEATFFEKDVIGVLCDENFNVITSTRKDIESGMNLRNYDDNKLIHTIISNGEARDDTAFLYREEGRDGVACVKKLKAIDWYVVTIVTPEALFSATEKITMQSIGAIIFICIIFSLYFSYVLYRSRKKRKVIEHKHLGAITALSSIYQDVFFLNLLNSKISVYRTNESTDEKYGNLNDSLYDENFKIFIEKEVYAEDRELFDSISTIEKVRKILSEQSEFSFIYRVAYDSELHFFQCDLLRVDAEQAVLAFKNVNELAWKRKEQEELQNIQEALNSGQWSMDFDRNYKIINCLWSDAFRRMLGYTNVADFPNDLESWTNVIHSEDKEKVVSEYWNIVNDTTGRKTFDITYRILTKNRGWRWVRSLGRLSRREDGSPLHFIGTFTDVDNQTKQLKNLSSIAGIYHTMHTIDLEENTVMEICTSDTVRQYVNTNYDAVSQMNAAMRYLAEEKYVDKILEFTDLLTVSERMKDKKIISTEFKGKVNGWIRASFIAVDVDSNKKPKIVLFVTQVVNEEKEREKKLITDANTDELTKIPNRHAFERDIKKRNGDYKKNTFTYVSIDVNSLKNVNDKYGHDAGDELLMGAATCLTQTFEKYGKVYRTGGDEFQAILFVEENELEQLKIRLKDNVSGWKGRQVDELSVSCGYVSRREFPTLTVSELAKKADQRMYVDKALFYESHGIDRRGQQAAFEALCKSYKRIFKVNLTTNSFNIVQAAPEEREYIAENNMTFLNYINDFERFGEIHEYDKKKYLTAFDKQKLDRYFKNDGPYYKIGYRRLNGESYNRISLEIIRHNEYSKDNQIIFMYEKEVENKNSFIH